MAFFGKLFAIVIIGAILIVTGLWKIVFIILVLLALYWLLTEIYKGFRGDKDDGRR